MSCDLASFLTFFLLFLPILCGSTYTVLHCVHTVSLSWPARPEAPRRMRKNLEFEVSMENVSFRRPVRKKNMSFHTCMRKQNVSLRTCFQHVIVFFKVLLKFVVSRLFKELEWLHSRGCKIASFCRRDLKKNWEYFGGCR